MCKENDREHERQVEEDFDRFIKQELLDAANEMRKDNGLPPFTEDEANGLDGLSAPDKMDGLLKLLFEVEKRPPIYIGNKDLRCLDNFLFGYRFAKREEDSDFGKWFENDFRVYLAKKYHDNRTLNVAGLIIENEEDGNSTDTFFRLLHEFLEKHAI